MEDIAKVSNDCRRKYPWIPGFFTRFLNVVDLELKFHCYLQPKIPNRHYG
jgi:hypothetical protein